MKKKDYNSSVSRFKELRRSKKRLSLSKDSQRNSKLNSDCKEKNLSKKNLSESSKYLSKKLKSKDSSKRLKMKC